MAQEQYKIKGSSELTENVMKLPLMKHFNSTDIMNNVNKFKKGEKGIFNLVKLLVIGGLIFSICYWVVPPVFAGIGRALGQVAQIAVTIVGSILFLFCLPGLIKLCRVIARKFHKFAIEKDPFLQLEFDRKRIVANNTALSTSRGGIKKLQSDMEAEATNSEKEAAKLQGDIIKGQAKAERLRNELQAMVTERGNDVKGEDEYVDKSAELMKVLSDSQRDATRLQQKKDFVQKYGSRGNVMKKMSQKLKLAETAAAIKLDDFDATVEMLKADSDFASKSRAATDAAKSAMLFQKSWERDYAMDVVTNAIAEDIAITSSNLRDIDSITSQYDLNSDELYDNLNLLADKIKAGQDEVPEAKQYRNADYKLSSDDKVKSGGMQDIFD